MERVRKSIFSQADWLSIGLFIVMVVLGWLNIFAAVYDPELDRSIFSLSVNSGKQLLWISLGCILILIVFLFDARFYFKVAYWSYGGVLLALIAVLVFGRVVAGSKSWFELGFIRIQPAEFAKLATSLALARFFAEPGTKLMTLKGLSGVFIILILPIILIMLQGDTGSALVFLVFILVLYREGLPDYIMGLGVWGVTLFILTLIFKESYLYHLIGIIAIVVVLYTLIFSDRKWGSFLKAGLVIVLSAAISLSVDFFVSNVLKPHQQQRIELLINPDMDAKGVGWQVRQSKIAIGSGGLTGKGFLEGTQTKFNFVPDQSTDFIFCTIGEEHGWLGSLLVITLFILLLCRIIILAERQKSRFSRVYGYCVASIIFFHFIVNIGMTVALFPVIGIPLPFFSYGGSSLWSFSILLFIMIKLDTQRKNIILQY